MEFIPFALILVAFYFLIVRPARSRQKAALELQQRIAPGVEVMTTSGLYGTVARVQEDSVELEVAPGTTLRFAKAAVGRVLEPADATAEGTGPTGDTEDTDDTENTAPIEKTGPAGTSDDRPGDDRTDSSAR